MAGLLVLVLLIALAALVLSLKHADEIRRLAGRLLSLQTELDRERRTLDALLRHVDRLGASPPDAETAPVTPPGVPISMPTPAPVVSAPQPKPTPPTGGSQLERQLGTRVAVWLGAVAFALAGAFLVKFTFDQGLLGPTTRVTIGIVFGLGLLGSGEWLRRRSAQLAQGMTASGVAVLFAALLAGINLYDLIPPAIGFGAMALTTGVAVFLSLRHGPFVALLGLLGGFLTPLLIGSEESHPLLLLTYLLLLQGGLLLVSRRMKWWPIAALTVLSVAAWGLLWILELTTMGGGTAMVGAYLLLSVLTLTAVTTRGEEDWGDDRIAPALHGGGAGLAVLLSAGLVGVSEFGSLEWTYLGLLGAGCLWLGWRRPGHAPLVWAASLITAAMLFLWGLDLGMLSGLGTDAAERTRFWWTTLTLGALYSGGTFALIWRSDRPERWAALSGVSGMAFLLASYAGLVDQPYPVAWPVQTLVLAALFAAGAWSVARRRESLPRGDATLAVLALTVVGLVSLAVPMALERAWIGVAWALEVPLLAWLAWRLRLRALEIAAAALGVGVLVRLLLNPEVFYYPLGGHPLFNWMLYGYGVPTAALAIGAWLLWRDGRTWLARGLGTGSLSLGFVWLTLGVHQFFHPGDLGYFGATSDAEMYAYSLAWILFAMGLLVAGILSGGTVLRYGSAAVMLLAVGKVFLIDTAQLQDLYRVVSFFGLGLSLMLLAFLYQRFVFREWRSQGKASKEGLP